MEARLPADKTEQGRREPERAPDHNLRAAPSDIFSFNRLS